MGRKVIQAVDKELTNREGNHVGKPSFFYRQFLRNKALCSGGICFKS
ncbi:hypothetical protein L249_3338, partial [Ophiocordyceps polyrhachis-furcata BCC 54312]